MPDLRRLQHAFDEEAAGLAVRRLRRHAGDWSIRSEPLFSPAALRREIAGLAFALTLAAAAWLAAWVATP